MWWKQLNQNCSSFQQGSPCLLEGAEDSENLETKLENDLYPQRRCRFLCSSDRIKKTNPEKRVRTYKNSHKILAMVWVQIIVTMLQYFLSGKCDFMFS